LPHENTELYQGTKKFFVKVYELDLYNKCSLLKGSDLLEQKGRIYTVEYRVFRGVVQLEAGQSTHTNGPDAEMMARKLLREMVDSG
jgi:hypothetical protein